MLIPQEVQDKLKCSECSELLSCGPVYLLHKTGGTICGRCSQQSEDATENRDRTRIEPYEAVASLLAFPCAHRTRGCSEKHSFSLGHPPHELNCKFRPIFCPIAPRGTCEWIGSWPDLKEHCDNNHASNVLKNKSDIPRPDLTSSNLQTYLISAFRFLFLLHVKVCVTSGKLFHSLRLFGNSEFFDKFSYSLEMKGNKKKLIEGNSVLPSGLLMFQESTANFLTINSLLDVLRDNYNESKFTISIQTSITFKKCVNCSKIFENIPDVKFCKECIGKLIKCEFSEKGCPFVDFYKYKCEDHSAYFCDYRTKCYWCEKKIVRRKLINHLLYCRDMGTADLNEVVYLFSEPLHIIYRSDNFGYLLCEFDPEEGQVSLTFNSSLPSYEMKKLKCSVELTDSETKYTKTLTEPYISSTSCRYDWLIDEDGENFESCQVEMKVNLFEV